MQLDAAARKSQVCVSLVQALADLRGVAQSWEQQTADALGRIEQLKEMLGEGVDWQVSCPVKPSAAVGQQRLLCSSRALLAAVCARAAHDNLLQQLLHASTWHEPACSASRCCKGAAVAGLEAPGSLQIPTRSCALSWMQWLRCASAQVPSAARPASPSRSPRRSSSTITDPALDTILEDLPLVRPCACVLA